MVLDDNRKNFKKHKKKFALQNYIVICVDAGKTFTLTRNIINLDLWEQKYKSRSMMKFKI